MANSSNRSIDILFGVKGGSDIGGASGKNILRQLNKLANSISTNSPPEVVFRLDVEETRSTIQRQLNKIGKSLSFNVKTAGEGGGKKQEDNGWQKNLETNMASYEATVRRAKAELNNGLFTSLDKSGKNVYQNEQEYVDGLVASADKILEKKRNQQTLTKQDYQDLAKQTQELNKQLAIQRQILAAEQKRPSSANSVISRAEAKIRDIYNDHKDAINADPELLKRYNALMEGFSDGSFAKAGDGIAKMNEMVGDFEKECAKANITQAKLGRGVKKLFTQHSNTAIAMAAIAALRRAMSQLIQNVTEMDKAVTDLQIATGKTRSETWKLMSSYSQLAQKLGATVTDVASAADTWLRQGYSIAEANELITQSMYLSKLGQIDSAAASTALTSAMKGYKMEVSEASSIVDKLTAVDMEAAASAGGLATAMAETANSARLSGVSMDQLIGQLAVVKEVTQDGDESVGTFFKTMYARMGNIKAGNLKDPETGEDLSDVESTLAGVGIKLRDSESQFRNFGDVLYEVAGQWDTYSNVQQRAIARAFGNTRQQEKFLVLMENYDDVLKYAEVAANSAGTAAKKYQAAYLTSIEASKQKFMATFQEVSEKTLDSSVIVMLVDLGSVLLKAIGFLTQFLSKLNGLPVKIGLYVAALVLLNKTLKAHNLATWDGVAAHWAKLKAMLANIPVVKAATTAYATAGGGLLGFKAAVQATTASLWEMAKAFLATPFGMFTVALTVIVGLTAAAVAATDRWKKKFESLGSEIEKINEEIDAAKSEVTAYQELSKALQDAAGNKEKLAELYDELKGKGLASVELLNGEAKAYSEAQSKISGYIEAKEKFIAQKEAEANSKKLEQADILGVERTGFDLSNGHMLLAAKTYNEVEDKNKDFVLDAFDITAEELETWLSQYVSLVQEGMSGIIASYSGAGGTDFLNYLISDLVGKGKSVDQIKSIIEKVMKDAGFQEAYEKYVTSLSDPNADTKSAYNKLAESLKSYGVTVDSESFSWLVTLADCTNDAAEAATVAEQSFADLYDAIKDKASAIKKAQQDMDKYGRLSAESIVSMEEAGLLDYLEKSENGYTLCENALEKLVNIQTSSAITAAKGLIGWNDSLAKSYGDTVDGVLAAAKAQKEAAKVQYLVSNRATAGIDRLIAEKQWKKTYGKQYDAAIANIEKQIKNTEKQKALYDSILQDSASEKASSVWKDALEEKKHLLDIGKITEQEYYQWIIDNYQKMLGSYKENADEKKSIEEDYFKWLKSQYKDDLSAQKDNLNKQKEALKDFYDRRKEYIEQAYDDQEKTEKRSEYMKEIESLERRVFALQADNSQSGKRQLLETQEELDEKLKEYQKWERENSKDALLDRLDEEYQREEQKIEYQVSAIESKVDSLDKSAYGIYDIIRRWGADHGYPIPFQASGTANAPGGVSVTQEKGAELLGMNVGGAFTYLTPKSKVWNASATDFLYKFANAPSTYLARFMRGIAANAPDIHANNVSFGDIVISGNADASTVSALRKERENIAKEVLVQFKKLQRT